MTSYIALEAPAWLAVLATLALFAAGVALGAIAAVAVQLFRARAPALDERNTIPTPTPSIELPADRDTLPSTPWHTHAAP